MASPQTQRKVAASVNADSGGGVAPVNDDVSAVAIAKQRPCDCSGRDYRSCSRGVKNSMGKPLNYFFSTPRTSKLGLILEG